MDQVWIHYYPLYLPGECNSDLLNFVPMKKNHDNNASSSPLGLYYYQLARVSEEERCLALQANSIAHQTSLLFGCHRVTAQVMNAVMTFNQLTPPHGPAVGL